MPMVACDWCSAEEQTVSTGALLVLLAVCEAVSTSVCPIPFVNVMDPLSGLDRALPACGCVVARDLFPCCYNLNRLE